MPYCSILPSFHTGAGILSHEICQRRKLNSTIFLIPGKNMKRLIRPANGIWCKNEKFVLLKATTWWVYNKITIQPKQKIWISLCNQFKIKSCCPKTRKSCTISESQKVWQAWPQPWTINHRSPYGDCTLLLRVRPQGTAVFSFDLQIRFLVIIPSISVCAKENRTPVEHCAGGESSAEEEKHSRILCSTKRCKQRNNDPKEKEHVVKKNIDPNRQNCGEEWGNNTTLH